MLKTPLKCIDFMVGRSSAACVSERVGYGSSLYSRRAATQGQRIRGPLIRSVLYPQSAVTSSLCYRGGRLHAAAQPRSADTVGVRIRGRRIGTILYPSTAATNKSVSEFHGNTIEVTEVCERGELLYNRVGERGSARGQSQTGARARGTKIRYRSGYSCITYQCTDL
jgi:hypothetical protein